MDLLLLREGTGLLTTTTINQTVDLGTTVLPAQGETVDLGTTVGETVDLGAGAGWAGLLTTTTTENYGLNLELVKKVVILVLVELVMILEQNSGVEFGGEFGAGGDFWAGGAVGDFGAEFSAGGVGGFEASAEYSAGGAGFSFEEINNNYNIYYWWIRRSWRLWSWRW